jgi:oxygen-independent coproporphyrinogen-3 oxidase
LQSFHKAVVKVVIFEQKTYESFQILNIISNFALEMAGLYIHIPFCKNRCIYCGFYSTVDLELRQRYVDAVCREMQMRSLHQPPSGDDERIETVYLGGGTPSQLTIPQLRQLFIYINKVYDLTRGQSPCEVTVEVNPDDVTVEYAAVLQELGINRISMGIQTFDDQRLRFLHRRHTAAQVPVAIHRLRNAGIRNVSIDLMYGFPGETLDDWRRDIDAALALDVEHLSAYCLTLEEGTPLYEQMRNEKLAMRNDKAEELERQMYESLIDKLTAAGYEHYEISNFARPGYRSRHNSSYWHDIPYIGLGAAAHSYDGSCRSWNVSDIRQYIGAIERGKQPSECEVHDADTHYNDRITTALRTSDGLDLTTLSDRYRRYCLQEARQFLADGLLRLADNRLVLTRKGLFVSDMVMSGLMSV